MTGTDQAPRRRTTLFVTDGAFHPARSGAPLRMLQLATALASLGDLHVLSFGLRDDDASMPFAASWLHLDRRDHPETAASKRDRLLRLVRRRQYPFENDRITRRVGARVRAHLRGLRPDLVVLSHWRNALPDALRGPFRLVVDAHNVESDLAEQLMRASGPLTARRRYTLANHRRAERRLLEGADQVWFTSEVDERAARRFASLASSAIVPNAVDVEAYAGGRDRTAPVAAPTILYAGAFFYAPNAIAARILIDDVLPLVRRSFPGTRLVLAGKEPTPEMTAAAARDPRIVVTGAVPSMQPYLDAADVTVIALRDGSGTRLKVLEAFAAGLPVVSTRKGAEGIGARDGEEIRIAEEAAGLARATVDLLSDARARGAQIAAARELVVRDYSWRAATARVASALDALETAAR